MSRQDATSIPRLDLSPKLDRPLSLGNPLDYLRLLYWAFFFPQALRWYVQRFGHGIGSLLRFLLQALLVTLLVPIVPVALIWVLRAKPIVALGFAFYIGLLATVMFVLATWGWGMAHGYAIGVAAGVVAGSTIGVAYGAVSFVRRDDLVAALMGGIAFGMTFGVPRSVASSTAFRLAFSVVFGTMLGVMYGLWLGVAAGLASALATLVAVSRPGVWLVGSLVTFVGSRGGHGLFQRAASAQLPRVASWFVALLWRDWVFPHATPLPLLGGASRLVSWLRQDWEAGVHNANELLAYTFQLNPVIQSVSRVINEAPLDQVVPRVACLTETLHDRHLPLFISAFCAETERKAEAERDSLHPGSPTALRLDTPARAAAAGFWYLYEKEPEKAAWFRILGS